MVSSYYGSLPSTHDIIEVTAPLRKALQTLILDQRFEYNPNIERLDTTTHFGKLQNLIVGFHDLTQEAGMMVEEDEELETDDQPQMEFVESFQHKLPQSLQNLCIFGARESLESVLLEVSDRDEGILPNLKSVIVDAPLDLHADFEGTGIDYMEVNHQSLMCGGIGLEDYIRGCWQQMEHDRKNRVWI